MTFMLKKKKFKFHVDFLLADLSDVPFVNAVLFAKVRLLDGGNFCELSPRVDVVNHHVCWGKPFQFSCRIASHPQTGILEPRICRVSIRKELKGGKSYQKLGFCDINLSEYAGSGAIGITRTYLLEGYDSGQQRQDNSLLRVNITMTLQSADPCFKVPVYPLPNGNTQQPSASNPNPNDRRVRTGPGGEDGVSVNSVSSGFESLPRQQKAKPKPQTSSVDEMPEHDMDPGTSGSSGPGHSRNSSQTSQQSQGSGYASGKGSHSRQSSSESGNVHVRRPSVDLTSTAVVNNNLKAPPPVKMRTSMTDGQPSNSQSRIDSTRVDADELIEKLIKDHVEIDRNPVERNYSGLQLYISKEDGSASVVGSSQEGRYRGGGLFEQVIIDDQIN